MEASANASGNASGSLPRPSIGSEISTGFRRNLVPGLILQSLALAIALGYFYWPAGKAVCDHWADLKKSGGYPAGAAVTAVCGGLIPWLVMRWRRDVPKANPVWDCTYMMLYWAWAGFEVDYFYDWQAVWWGNGSAVATIIAKVACDQFGFTLFLAVPQMRACFRWRESGYRADAWKGLTIPAYLREVVILAASAWVVWIPGTSIIYAMPQKLQFLLFAVDLVFWSLVAAVAGRPRKPAAT